MRLFQWTSHSEAVFSGSGKKGVKLPLTPPLWRSSKGAPAMSLSLVLWCMVLGAQYRRDEPSLAGNAIRQEQEVLIPCLHQLLESGLTSWTDRMNMSFLTEFYKHVGAEFCLSYFSLNLYIRGVIFDLVSKIFEYICLHKQVQTFAWLSPSGCEAVQAGSCAIMFYTEAVELRISNANKRGLPAASSSHLVGPARGRSSVWLPLPICGEMSNVNTNPVNFHKFVTASLAYTEASHSLPPSWSCWEFLD